MYIADALEEKGKELEERLVELENLNTQNPGLNQNEINEMLPLLNPNDLVHEDIEFIVKRFQDFPLLLNFKRKKFLEFLIAVIASMINLISTLLNIVTVATTLSEVTGYSPLMIKLSSLPIYTLVLIFIIEPEKLKILTMIWSIAFLFIGNEFINEKQ